MPSCKTLPQRYAIAARLVPAPYIASAPRCSAGISIRRICRARPAAAASIVRSPRRRQQLSRLAFQGIGKIREALDGDAGASVLVRFDGAGRDANRPGELALGEATRLADFGNPGAHTAVDGALSLHGTASCPQIFLSSAIVRRRSCAHRRTVVRENEHMSELLTNDTRDTRCAP